MIDERTDPSVTDDTADGHGDGGIRRRIEALGSRLSLPTARRALGVLEGEHPSRTRGAGYEFLELREYEPADEARRIDWHASARHGRPMVVNKEREVNGNIWLLLDGSAQMTGAAAGGERSLDVAANALRMFARLSLRRSDGISLVTADADAITRIPFTGGFGRFEMTLDRALTSLGGNQRHIDALLRYAERIRDRRSLVVIATDDMALGEPQIERLRLLATTHPLVVVDVATLNPFDASGPVRDGVSGRTLGAFLRGRHARKAAEETRARREFLRSSLERQLNRSGATLMAAGSSQGMFDTFVALLSGTMGRASYLPGSSPRAASAPAPPQAPDTAAPSSTSSGKPAHSAHSTRPGRRTRR